MKYNRKNIFRLFFIGMLIFISCDPNEELYETMDNEREPYNENFSYTLEESDYNMFDGFVEEYHAFNDTISSKEYIPDILKLRFVTLGQGSNAIITFNHFLLEPDWWKAGFGYELTEEDYSNIGVDGAFSEQNNPQSLLPSFLLKNFTDAQEGDVVSVIYRFDTGGETIMNLDRYELIASTWVWTETIENIPYVGYELTEEDYQKWSGYVANFQSFNEENPPEMYLPSFLSAEYAYAPVNAEQVIKYNYYDGEENVERIDKYQYNGTQWIKEPYVEERSEQYIYGELGWAFDPTVTFTMRSNDYMYLVEVDPIGQQELPYDDFAYYYGASAFYNNFDVRLLSRRLDELEDGSYADPELAAIYESDGEEAAREEMFRRIVEEGIPQLLQHKYPNAQPEVEGIEVHYFVSFQTFADNWVRRNPTAEYICTAAGDPPQFELVNVVSDDEDDE